MNSATHSDNSRYEYDNRLEMKFLNRSKLILTKLLDAITHKIIK